MQEERIPPEMDGRHITCTGRVCAIEYKEGTMYLYLNHLKVLSNTELSEKYQVKIILNQPIQAVCGNLMQASGKAALAQEPANDGQFDSRLWQRQSGLLFTLKKASAVRLDRHCSRFRQFLFCMRQKGMRQLQRVMPLKDAGIVGAMLFGDRTELQEETEEWYRAGGISHILAISGLHISMIGMLLYKILKKSGLPIPVCAVISGDLMILYAVFTGAGTATCRAVIMFLTFLFAQCLGRTYDLGCALALAVILLLLSEPFLLFSSGFQLSVLAVAGLAFVHPAFRRAYGRNVPAGLSIQLILLPCILWHYYTFPVYGILLNVLVIPLAPFVLGGGILALALSAFCIPAAILPGLWVHGILSFYEGACRAVSALPYSQILTGCPPAWAVAVYYILLFAGSAVLEKKNLERKKLMCVRFGYPMCLLGVFFFFFQSGFAGLTLSFLDVGQGDCIFMQNEKGISVLCDGGSSSVGKVGKYRILPYLRFHGVGKLDYVFLTHMDADHVNGIKELLEMENSGIEIGTLVLANGGRTEDDLEMLELAEKRRITVRRMGAGEQLRLGELSFTCLHPDRIFETKDKNEASLVLHARYGSFDAMLMGDLEEEGERYLIDSGRLASETGVHQTEVLKAGHHGSKGATSEELLRILQPGLAVLSYGKNNRYGHPAAETIERLNHSGCRIVSTENCGQITIFCHKSGKITIRDRKNMIK